MPDTIRIDRDDRGVATLWLTRAEKHNALSRPMMDELTQAAADHVAYQRSAKALRNEFAALK